MATSSLLTTVKLEEESLHSQVNQETHTVASMRAVAVKTETEDDAVVNCIGCARTQGVSRSYWESESTVEWAFPTGRGFWCKDCHGCWRLLFSQEHTLMIFSQWLRSSSNHATWEMHLVCYLMFVAEGCQRVTATAVRERIQGVKFLFNLLNFQMIPSNVVLLDAMPDDINGTQSGGTLGFDPRALTTVRTTQGDRLGMFVAMDLLSVRGPAVCRPLLPGLHQALNSRAFLSTELQTDMEFMRDRFGADFQSSAIADAASVLASMTKLETKFECYRVAALEVLKTFTESSWESVKESTLTKPLHNINSVLSEASATGEGEVIKSAQAWVVGLMKGKTFLKLHRDWIKANHRHDRLLGLSDSLQAFRTFLTNVTNLQCSPSFDLLHFKTSFFDRTTNPAEALSTSTALDHIIKGGLQTVFVRMKSNYVPGCLVKKVSPEAWLRSMLVKALGITLAVEAPEGPSSTDARAQILLDDVRAVLALLAKITEDTSVSFRELTVDLQHLVALLRGVCDPSELTGTETDDALKALEDVRLAQVKTDLSSSETGKAILAANSCLLQASSKDICATGKLELAIKILMDERLPMLVIDNAKIEGLPDASVRNFAELSEMAVMDSLEESLQHVVEAFRLWSAGQACKHAVGISQWVQRLCGNLKFYDECLSVLLQGIVAVGMGKMWWPSADDFEEEWTLDDELAGFKLLQPAFQKHVVDETPLDDFIPHLVKFLAGMPEGLRQQGSVAEYQSQLQDVVLHNMRARAAITDVLDACVHFPEVLTDATDVLCDWKLKKSQGVEATSFMGKSIEMLKLIAAMPAEGLKLGVGEGELRVSLEEGAGLTHITGSFPCAEALNLKVQTLLLPKFLKAMLAECVQKCVDDFVDTLVLEAVCPGAKLEPITQASKVPEYLDRLFDKLKAAENVKVTAKVMAAASGKQWPCVEMLALLRELCLVVPQGSFEVSAVPLLREGAEPAVFDNKEQVLNFCDLFMAMSQVCSVLAYLRVRFMASSSDSVTRDNKCKSEVESACSFLRTTVNLTIAKLQSKAFGDWSVWDLAAWRVPPRYCEAWLLQVQAALPMIHRLFLCRICEDLAALTQEVAKVSPRTDHIVTTDKVNETLAKRHLLGWQGRSTLNSKTVALFGSLQCVARIHTEWNLLPALIEDPDFCETIDAAKVVFTTARTTITYIAALNVLLELKGKEQAEEASNLLMTKADQLPEILVQKLRNITEKATTASPAKAAKIAP